MEEKSFTMMIPLDLHTAFRKKLANDRRTAREVIIRFLKGYTGYMEKENVESKPEEPRT